VHFVGEQWRGYHMRAKLCGAEAKCNEQNVISSGIQ